MPEPSWEELLLAQIDKNLSKYAARRTFTLNLPEPMVPFMVQAASERDMSLTAYHRRAVMSFVVHDLGADWFDLMKYETRVTKYRTDPGVRAEKGVLAQGHGYGLWKIESLGDYDA